MEQLQHINILLKQKLMKDRYIQRSIPYTLQSLQNRSKKSFHIAPSIPYQQQSRGKIYSLHDQQKQFQFVDHEQLKNTIKSEFLNNKTKSGMLNSNDQRRMSKQSNSKDYPKSRRFDSIQSHNIDSFNSKKENTFNKMLNPQISLKNLNIFEQLFIDQPSKITVKENICNLDCESKFQKLQKRNNELQNELSLLKVQKNEIYKQNEENVKTSFSQLVKIKVQLQMKQFQMVKQNNKYLKLVEQSKKRQQKLQFYQQQSEIYYKQYSRLVIIIKSQQEQQNKIKEFKKQYDNIVLNHSIEIKKLQMNFRNQILKKDNLIQELQTKIQLYSKNISQLSNQLQINHKTLSLQQKLKDQQVANQNYNQQQIRNLQTKIKKLENTIQQNFQRQEKIQIQICSHQRQILGLQKQLSSQQQLNKNNFQKQKDFKQKIQILLKENEGLNNILSDLNSKIDQSNVKNDQLVIIKQNLTNQLKYKHQQTLKIWKMIEELQQKLQKHQISQQDSLQKYEQQAKSTEIQCANCQLMKKNHLKEIERLNIKINEQIFSIKHLQNLGLIQHNLKILVSDLNYQIFKTELLNFNTKCNQNMKIDIDNACL